jgi:class 3 adenylate cyclase
MAEALDQIVKFLQDNGPIGTAIAVTAIPVAIYVTRMGSQAKIDRLEGELSRLKEETRRQLDETEKKFHDISERYENVLKTGALIQSQLDSIVQITTDLANRIDAEDCSVLVPAPTSIPADRPSELVFLHSSGPQWATLRWVRVPIKGSLSGEVFESGGATIAEPRSPDTFSQKTDKALEFKTRETLSVCLRWRQGHVGVVQFLNKRRGRFDAADIDVVTAFSSELAIRVGDFTSDSRRLIELGHAPRRNKLKITAMFCDLTGYARLCSQIDNSVMVDLLNQYLQTVCDIAIRNGGLIDQYTGDGVLILFNVDNPKSGAERTALGAALEMREAFRSLKTRWIALGYGAKPLFLRIGLSCGEATRAEIGHSQSRRLTMIGSSVNAAAEACEAAPRNHDAICGTMAILDAVGAAPGWEFRALSGGEIFELIA